MGLPKGTTNNPNGRPKGKPNKLTKELRELVSDLVSNELENLPDRLSNMNDKDRVEVLMKLLPYVVPKPKPSSQNDRNEERPIFTGISLELESTGVAALTGEEIQKMDKELESTY